MDCLAGCYTDVGTLSKQKFYCCASQNQFYVVYEEQGAWQKKDARF
jgi:hypothetical protein